MDHHRPIPQRFPLVARFRPACLPLPQRVRSVRDMAVSAADTCDQGLASAVYNQAALIASDVGVPQLARELCHQHAAAYLHACPLPGMTVIRALEPVVNLVRLHIRAGHADDGRRRLLGLHEAVSSGTTARFEGITVPADLAASPEDRQEIRVWLWRVLIADGTRTLTAAGRWTDALAHIKEHRGAGKRMLDGRQVAVIAALTTGDTTGAAELLAETVPGDPWEQAVTACLNVMCRRALGHGVRDHLCELVDRYLHHQAEHGMTVFDVRLGLTILDFTTPVQEPAAHRIVRDLHRRTSEAADGYAARECLAHPLFGVLAAGHHVQECRDLVRACALGSGTIPDDIGTVLSDVVRLSDRVIRDSLDTPRNKRNTL